MNLDTSLSNINNYPATQGRYICIMGGTLGGLKYLLSHISFVNSRLCWYSVRECIVVKSTKPKEIVKNTNYRTSPC